jgi:hypothetical protein
MRSILKCVHPLLPASIAMFALFGLLCFSLRAGIGDIFPVGHGGPCFGLPVLFLLFVPIVFCFVLGVGFSAIRFFEFRSRANQSGKQD